MKQRFFAGLAFIHAFFGGLLIVSFFEEQVKDIFPIATLFKCIMIGICIIGFCLSIYHAIEK